MKKQGFFLFFLLSLFYFYPAYPLEIGDVRSEFESNTYINYDNLKGSTEKSINSEGAHYVEEVTWDLFKKINLYKLSDIQTHLSFRYTDDPQYKINNRRFYFLEGFFKYINPKVELWGGDFAEDYTTYTFSSSLLGVKAKINFTDKLVFMSFAGRNRDKDMDGYLRYTEGARLAYKGKVLSLGVSVVGGHVDSSTIKASSGIGEEKNVVAGTDLKINIGKGIIISGEMARSMYNENETTAENQYDSAYLLSIEWNADEKIHLRGEFERVEPWFKSIYGSASSDIQRYKAEANFFPLDNLSFMGSFEYSFDKVSSHSDLEMRTYTKMGYLSVDYTPFYNSNSVLSSLTLSLQADYSRMYNKEELKETDNKELRLSTSISQSFSHWNYSLNYAYTKYWDYIDDSAPYFSHNPEINIGINFSKWNILWNWGTNISYNYRETVKTHYIDKTWRGEVMLSLMKESTNTNLNLNFSVEKTKSNNYDGSSKTTLYTYGAMFDQVLKQSEKFYASLSINAAHNTYIEKGTSGEGYREDILNLRFNLKF